MLGGTLADEYGGKRVMAAGVVLWSLFTFLTPISAAMGTVFLISCRIAMGLGEVCTLHIHMHSIAFMRHF